MVHTTRDGRVYTEVGEVDVDLGTIAKDEELDQWKGDCALCEEFVLASTKSAAIDSLEDHFVTTHTAQG